MKQYTLVGCKGVLTDIVVTIEAPSYEAAKAAAMSHFPNHTRWKQIGTDIKIYKIDADYKRTQL